MSFTFREWILKEVFNMEIGPGNTNRNLMSPTGLKICLTMLTNPTYKNKYLQFAKDFKLDPEFAIKVLHHTGAVGLKSHHTRDPEAKKALRDHWDLQEYRKVFYKLIKNSSWWAERSLDKNSSDWQRNITFVILGNVGFNEYPKITKIVEYNKLKPIEVKYQQ